MNYLAHGYRYLDRPWFLAGTAIPDWLSVADRKVRIRPRHLTAFVDRPGVAAEIAAGAQQHLDDDQWFHGTRTFFDVSTELAVLFREMPELNDGFRPGFLGHIVTELLMDAELIERHSGLIDDYYAAMDSVEASRVQQFVNEVSPRKAENLARFIDIFRQSQFLRDYVRSDRLLFRINQVMQRVRLPKLPDDVTRILDTGRTIVGDRLDELLPK